MTLRVFYFILFLISVGMLVYNLVRSRRFRNEVSTRMSVLMGAFIVEAVACLVSAFVRSEETASIAFSFAYIATDVMLLYLYVLIRFFAKQPYISKLRIGILFSLITADCLSMFANVFFGHAFTVYQIKRCGEYFSRQNTVPACISEWYFCILSAS